MSNILPDPSCFFSLFNRQLWSTAALLAIIAGYTGILSAEEKKAIPASGPSAEKNRGVPEPNSPVTDPNDPNATPTEVPIQITRPDPNAPQTPPVSTEIRRLILSRSVSATAASRWITQGEMLPSLPPKQNITVVAGAYDPTHRVYDQYWLWDNWYCNYFLDPYHSPVADEYFNYTGVRMSLEANFSVGLSGWSY